MQGTVENGFFSIYESMSYVPIGGASTGVVDGIAAAVGNNQLTVIGHSLGSAIATYLVSGLAASGKLGTGLTACLFASPHAGDTAFVNYVDQQLNGIYRVYNYSRDIVPKVPFLLGYSPLPKATLFTPADANATIENTFGGNHHAVCYAAMINYGAANWLTMPKIDQDCADCIIGPNPLPTPAPAPAS